MDGWLALLSAFPTVIFAGMSVLCLFYWLLVMVGAADLDALDGVTGKAEGAVKGVVEGAADAVTSGVKGGSSAIAEAASALGLNKVPLTISLSMFSLLGLLIAATTRNVLDPLLPNALAAVVASVVSVVGAAVATVAVTRPLRGMFTDGAVEQGGTSLIGKTCTITIDADHDGGQARVGEVIVRVRVIAGRIGRDEEGVILERAEDGVFVIEPLKALMPTQQDAFARLQAESEAAAESVPAPASHKP